MNYVWEMLDFPEGGSNDENELQMYTNIEDIITDSMVLISMYRLWAGHQMDTAIQSSLEVLTNWSPPVLFWQTHYRLTADYM